MAGRFPSIPPSKTRDPAVEKLREAIEQGTGQRKNSPLDEWVTRGDLVQSGLGKIGRTGLLIPGDALGPRAPVSVGPLTNLEAVGTFKSIILTWDGTDQTGYAYTEIWRYDADNLAMGSLVATSEAPVIAIPTNDYRDYYFWVRAVSITDTPGPFNASAGVMAATTPDYETVRDVITATQWAPLTSYTTFQSVVPFPQVTKEGTLIRLLALNSGVSDVAQPDWNALITNLGDTVVDGTVVWEAVEAGKIPFYLDPGTGLVVIEGAALRTASIDSAKIMSLAVDKLFAVSGTIASALIGTAHITDAMIDRLRADKLYATTGNIATAIIGTGHISNAMIGNTIQSSGFSVAFESGWQILKSGAARFYDVVLTRPNIVASGTWNNPSTDFHWRCGFFIDGAFTEAPSSAGGEWVPTEKETVCLAVIDTSYDNTATVTNTRGPAFTARAIAKSGFHYYPSNAPGTNDVVSRPRVYAEPLFENTHYPSGSVTGAPGGRVFIRLTAILPRSLHPDITRYRLTSVDWSISEVT